MLTISTAVAALVLLAPTGKPANPVWDGDERVPPRQAAYTYRSPNVISRTTTMCGEVRGDTLRCEVGVTIVVKSSSGTCHADSSHEVLEFKLARPGLWRSMESFNSGFPVGCPDIIRIREFMRDPKSGTWSWARGESLMAPPTEKCTNPGFRHESINHAAMLENIVANSPQMAGCTTVDTL